MSSSESLLSKWRVFGGALSHSVTNEMLDMNKAAVIDQRVRDLENARKQMQSQLSDANFNVGNAKRDFDSHNATVEQIKADIRLLAGANNNNPDADQQKEIQAKLAMVQDMLEKHDTEAQHVQQLISVRDQMKEAVDATLKQETELKSRVQELKTADATSKSMNNAATAMENAQTARSSIDTSGLESSIARQENAAKDRFANALGQVPTASNPSETDKIKRASLLDSILGDKKQSAA